MKLKNQFIRTIELTGPRFRALFPSDHSMTFRELDNTYQPLSNSRQVNHIFHLIVPLADTIALVHYARRTFLSIH
jgi:hypothetical protein